MHHFFGFIQYGKKIYYFSASQRKNGVYMPEGGRIRDFESHKIIALYYGLDVADVNKFFYNPYSDKLVLIGKTFSPWTEEEIKRQLADIDWDTLAGDISGLCDFWDELAAIRWFAPDDSLKNGQNGIRLFPSRAAAWYEAKRTALVPGQPSIEDTARAVARDAGRDVMLGLAHDGAWAAAWQATAEVIEDAVFEAALAVERAEAKYRLGDREKLPLVESFEIEHEVFPVAGETERIVLLYACIIYTCAGLPVAPEDVDMIRKCMDVLRHGYGVCYYANGELYCYERVFAPHD